MVIRIALITALAVALMAAISNGTMLRRAGLTASCSVVRAEATGPALETCRAGWLGGPPNLTHSGCTDVGVRGNVEYWSCPR